MSLGFPTMVMLQPAWSAIETTVAKIFNLAVISRGANQTEGRPMIYL